MEKKIVKHHISGQKHHGKTDWAKVLATPNKIVVDVENPEVKILSNIRRVSQYLTYNYGGKLVRALDLVIVLPSLVTNRNFSKERSIYREMYGYLQDAMGQLPAWR